MCNSSTIQCYITIITSNAWSLLKLLNWKRGKNKSNQRWLQSAEMCNSSTIQCYITIITSNAWSLLKLPIFKNDNFTYDRCELYIYSIEFYETFEFLQTFYEISKLVKHHSKRAWEVAIFIF